MDVISFKETITKILNWIKKPYVKASSGDTFITSERSDTNVKIGFGVGSGGQKHGIWSYPQSNWMVYNDNGVTHLGYSNQNISNIYIGKFSVLDLVYPIGSIYMSTDGTSPATLFGGTWEKIPVSRTLISAGTSSETAVYLVNAIGGGTTTEYTPGGTVGGTTLTLNQIPSHKHVAVIGKSSTGISDYLGGSSADYGTFAGDSGQSGTEYNTKAAGGGGSHTHSFTGTKANISTMQPWYAVYMWRRTA